MSRPRIVILDSTPLGLLVRSPGTPEADASQEWFLRHSLNQVRFYVPEIILYELRRELLRLDLTADLALLEALVNEGSDRLLLLGSPALTLAAELWAKVRRVGRPTADRSALDIDVILAAQVLTAGWNIDDVIVATSNTKHIQLFVPAAAWVDI